MMKKALRIILILAGIVFFGGFIYRADPDDISEMLSTLGWMTPLTLLPYLVVYLVDTLGWYFAFGEKYRSNLPYFMLFRIRWAGEALNNVVPSAYIGGEALKIYLLHKRRFSATDATSSVIIGKTLQITTQIVFIVLGSIAFLQYGQAGADLRQAMATALGVGLAMIALLFWLQKRGIFLTLLQLLHKLHLHIRSLDAASRNLFDIDRQITTFYGSDTRNFLLSSGAYFGGWLLDTLDIFLVAYLLDVPIHWLQALAIEAFISVAKMMNVFVPGALGFQESGIIFLCRAVGLPEPFAFTYALIRRGRDLIFAIVGGVFLYSEETNFKGLSTKIRIGEKRRKMVAFIYAAGRGLRLGETYADTQKILLDIGGKSLLEWHVKRLTQIGIREMVIVTGFARHKIRVLLAQLQKRYGVDIKEIVNKHYSQGSVLSVHASLPEIRKKTVPVLLMDGDVLYATDLLRKIVCSEQRTALLIDRNYLTDDDDPVLVPIRNGKPVEFLKKWQGTSDVVGESVGFFKIDPIDIPLLEEETLKRCTGERRRESYDEIIRAMVLAGRFGYEDVTGIPWTEIDYPKDVDWAWQSVYPAILRHEDEMIRNTGMTV